MLKIKSAAFDWLRQRSNLIPMIMGLIIACISCGDEKRGWYATDNVPPGQVFNVNHDNVPGGAIITYSVPADDDLLYVRALYQMSDGRQVEQRSSAYTTKIVVEGLGRSKKQTVHLICGDRSGNESEPYPVDIEPYDSPIYDIKESIDINEDFGGIRLNWKNPLKERIVLDLYVKDKDGTFVEVESVYSASATGKYNLRGFPSEEALFGVTVRDRWGNKSDMIGGVFTPFFEEKLDRLKFGRWNPPGIPYIDLVGSGWTIERLWDGLLVDPGFSLPNTIVLPHSITFNMGQMAYLGRLKVWQRTSADQLYSGFNTKRFQVWGSSHPDVNADFATWIFLGDFTSIKPSGLPLGQMTEEDVAYATAGEDYPIQENSDIPVQYIRVHMMETWGGGTGAAQFYEMEFYGKIIK